MPEVCDGIRARLFLLADPAYRAFQQPLIPTVPPERVIGVRTPALRALARELAGTSAAETFRADLPHRYFEENQLHAFLIERIRHFGETVAALEAFLPYVDNWATCDMLSPKIFKKHLPVVYERVKQWLQSGHVYTVRFGIVTLLGFYLEDAFQPEMLRMVAEVTVDDYYVKMAVAWYFSIALVKQYDYAIAYIQKQILEPWTHNKAVQKAIESRRIAPEQKEYLRSLKVKY